METKIDTKIESNSDIYHKLLPITWVNPEDIVPHDIIKPPPVYYDTIVLSGASTKGLVTLGAIQYAVDNFLLKDLKIYIGTSSGAMICYLMAIGYTPVEIMVYICTNQLMEKMQHFNIVGMIQGRGATSFNNIHEQLEKMSIDKIGYLPTLKDLKDRYDKTLICVTHNITENKTEYLSHDNYPNLPCITALRMSSNLPLVFENYKYGNNLYVDGGVSDNFAIQIGETMGDKILGIILEPEDNNFNNETDMNTLEFIYKLIYVAVTQSIKYKISAATPKCRIIQIYHNKLKFFQFNVTSSMKLNMFSSGYEQMKKSFE